MCRPDDYPPHDGPPEVLGEDHVDATLVMRDGHRYTVHVIDERPEMEIDPTLLIFRDEEEEPVVTAHLNHDSPCREAGHVIVGKPERPDATCARCGFPVIGHDDIEDVNHEPVPVFRCESCRSPWGTFGCTNADCPRWEGPR